MSGFDDSSFASEPSNQDRDLHLALRGLLRSQGLQQALAQAAALYGESHPPSAPVARSESPSR